MKKLVTIKGIEPYPSRVVAHSSIHYDNQLMSKFKKLNIYTILQTNF